MARPMYSFSPSAVQPISSAPSGTEPVHSKENYFIEADKSGHGDNLCALSLVIIINDIPYRWWQTPRRRPRCATPRTPLWPTLHHHRPRMRCSYPASLWLGADRLGEMHDRKRSECHQRQFQHEWHAHTGKPLQE